MQFVEQLIAFRSTELTKPHPATATQQFFIRTPVKQLWKQQSQLINPGGTWLHGETDCYALKEPFLHPVEAAQTSGVANHADEVVVIGNSDASPERGRNEQLGFCFHLEHGFTAFPAITG